MAEALAARRLAKLRDRWLNPPEWFEWVDEPVPGYPKRSVPRDADAAKALRKRTLTNLYRHLEHRLRTDQDRAYGPELSLVLPGLPRSGSERPRVISGSTPPGRASWEADGTVGDEVRATAV